MKYKTTALLGIIICASALLVAPTIGFAALTTVAEEAAGTEVTPPDAAATVVLTHDAKVESIVQLLPDSVRGIIEPYLNKVPGIVFSILSVWGTLSLLWQAVIAWWHKRIAETTSLDDDAWTDKLSKAWWFRVLDKIFYFGGYIGAARGGKKL